MDSVVSNKEALKTSTSSPLDFLFVFQSNYLHLLQIQYVWLEHCQNHEFFVPTYLYLSLIGCLVWENKNDVATSQWKTSEDMFSLIDTVHECDRQDTDI